MKNVYLHYKSKEYTVTEEGFLLIKELVKQHQICTTCKRHHTKNNPIVGENICLMCFCVKHTLMYVGPWKEIQNGNMEYKFLDEHGYIHTSTADESNGPYQYTRLTIQHWQFALPTHWTIGEKEIELNQHNWTIYGDIPKDSVWVLRYMDRHNDGPVFTILSYKGGSWSELNKRSKVNRELFKRAKLGIEATKDQNGCYHILGKEQSWYIEVDTYKVIAHIESDRYDRERHFAKERKET